MKLIKNKKRQPEPPSFNRTKIIATIGPATNNEQIIEQLLLAGVDGFRMNFSHGEHMEHAERIEWIRQAAKRHGQQVAIIQDLQGPKIRIGNLPEPLTLQAGEEVKFGFQTDYHKTDIIPIQYDLSKRVQPGHTLLINDGKIKTRVLSVQSGVINTRVINGGPLSSRKGINLPDTNLEGDILTPKDLADIKFGANHDIDYIALSFVQNAGDIEKLRTKLTNLKCDAKIIAKIETRAATQDLEAIVMAADAVMVARGDLATETVPEAVPIFQRQITKFCMKHGTICIVATQMLASMTDAAAPTRAEVSDVATAVITGVDAVMLSEETAAGQFPVEAVKMMRRVTNYTEKHYVPAIETMKVEDDSQQGVIAAGIVELAQKLDAAAIVAETISGGTARTIAAHRPDTPIMMVASTARVANQLRLVYGGLVFYRHSPRAASERIIQWLKDRDVLHSGDVVVMASGRQGVVGSTDTIKVRVTK